MSIQAQILKLLADLKRDLSLTYLLIAHDLAVVRVLADRTGTMYLGKMCEIGATHEIFEHPAHPYTAALLSAISSTSWPRGESRADPPAWRAALTAFAAKWLPVPGALCVCARHLRRGGTGDEGPIGESQNVACHFPLVASA